MIHSDKSLTQIREMEQADGGPNTITAPRNSWNATLFPRWEHSPSPAGKHVVVTDPVLLPRCFSNCGVMSSDAQKQVIVTTSITYPLLQEAARNGSVLLLLQNSTTNQFFPTSTTRFKQAWWLGNSVDSNAGTVVYRNAAPVFGGMTAAGQLRCGPVTAVAGAQEGCHTRARALAHTPAPMQARDVTFMFSCSLIISL